MDKCALADCPEQTVAWTCRVNIRDRYGEAGGVTVLERSTAKTLELCQRHGDALRAAYPQGVAPSGDFWKRA